jgi:hypothetical protein
MTDEAARIAALSDQELLDEIAELQPEDPRAEALYDECERRELDI